MARDNEEIPDLDHWGNPMDAAYERDMALIKKQYPDLFDKKTKKVKKEKPRDKCFFNPERICDWHCKANTNHGRWRLWDGMRALRDKYIKKGECKLMMALDEGKLSPEMMKMLKELGR